MICPICRTSNDIGVRFCRKCGSSLQQLDNYTDYVGASARASAFLLDTLVTIVPTAFILWIAVGLSGIRILIILLLMSWVYSAALESSSRQGTLGKMAVGIRVVDFHGKRISFGTASVRYFVKVVTLGSFWYLVLVSEKRQGIHDMAANTYVVMDGPYSRRESTHKTPRWFGVYRE
ncbi:MAG: RDD family protein [Theionarchaea archaeon]|nr:RDD family protein [Theionarchaea archaeon]MBU7036385.1 RDD family protein [Theionarchaea archaeon]